MSRHQPRSRYTAYDGGPDPLAPPVDIAEALDAIGEDVMAGYSPERAMREFLRAGHRDQRGLDDLARRIAEKRRELTQRHNLDGTLQEVRELLDHAVLERAQAAGPRHRPRRRRPGPARAPARQPAALDGRGGQRAQPVRLEEPRGPRGLRADQGPARPGDARPAVRRHEAGARERHRRRPRGDQRDAHRPQRPAGQARARRGHPEDFADFMDKHGDFFPENPQNVDELIDAMAQRAAAAQRMMNSMTRRAAGRADGAGAAGVRVAGAHAAARRSSTPTSSPCAPVRTGAAPSGSTASRGSGSATAPASCRTSPTSTTSPSSSRSPTTARGSTTSTSTSWPASSATRRPSTPAPCSGSSRRCATPATSSAPATASSSSARRRCASSARRCSRTSPPG